MASGSVNFLWGAHFAVKRHLALVSVKFLWGAHFAVKRYLALDRVNIFYYDKVLINYDLTP
jgi:hypothetical protein